MRGDHEKKKGSWLKGGERVKAVNRGPPLGPPRVKGTLRTGAQTPTCRIGKEGMTGGLQVANKSLVGGGSHQTGFRVGLIRRD